MSNPTDSTRPTCAQLSAPPTAAVTTGRSRGSMGTRIAAVLLGAGVLAVLIAASHAPFTFNPADDAMLRVAWSARPERVESCTTLSEEELEKLPAHMRQRVVCEGTTASYRLEILRDGHPISTAILRGGGLRHDRQLYAYQQLPVPHGRSTFQVTLTRIDSGTSIGGREGAGGAGEMDDNAGSGAATDRERRELDERRRRVEDEVPAALSLSETVDLAPREVALLTYDPGSRSFRLVRRDESDNMGANAPE